MCVHVPADRRREPFELIEAGEGTPGKRYGHTTVLDESGGGVLLVLGGCNDKGQFEQGLFYYNLGKEMRFRSAQY